MRIPSRGVDRRVSLLAGLAGVAGVVLTLVGIASWLLVRRRLAEERITVEEDADHFAGDLVAGPLTAYTEAEIINRHARDAAGGKAYAELESDHPASETVLTGSLLSASLFTSVLAFGVAALATGLGLIVAGVGVAMAWLNRRAAGSARWTPRSSN